MEVKMVMEKYKKCCCSKYMQIASMYLKWGLNINLYGVRKYRTRPGQQVIITISNNSIWDNKLIYVRRHN